MKNTIKRILNSAGYELRKITHTPQVESDGSIVVWEEGGQLVRFFIENRFDLIGRDIFNCRFFEREELDVLRNIVKPNGTMVDVGANIGNHAVFFSSILKADKVVAFEPGAFAHPRLCFNIALNGLSGLVDIQKVALSDTSGTAEMRFIAKDNHGTLAIMENGKGEGQTEVVPKLRGDDVLGSEHVTLLKIDAERHELQVLRGLDQTLKRCKPVILVEADLQDREQVETLLATYGYSTKYAFERYGDIVNIIAVA